VVTEATLGNQRAFRSPAGVSFSPSALTRPAATLSRSRGRGRIVRRPPANRNATIAAQTFVSSRRYDCCSLSRRERVRVRGNEAYERERRHLCRRVSSLHPARRRQGCRRSQL
jgi:hypothetical protein